MYSGMKKKKKRIDTKNEAKKIKSKKVQEAIDRKVKKAYLKYYFAFWVHQ